MTRVLLMIVLAFACAGWVGAAENQAGEGVLAAQSGVGWRGDGTGVFPKTDPPTTWSRIATNSIVTGLYCSSSKPKSQEAEGVLIDDGHPRNWLVLGPFDNVNTVDTLCLPNEAELQGDVGTKVGDKEWKPYNLRTEKELDKFNPGYNKEGEYYMKPNSAVGGTAAQAVLAHTYLFSPRAGKVRMYMAHGGGLEIYVNGKEAYRTANGAGMWTANASWYQTVMQFHWRFLRGDGPRDTFADLELSKGWNSVLIKLIKGGNINAVIHDIEEMKFETKNILWTAKMPEWGMCGPIVVKDKVFVTAEPDELICIDRNTGNILWHASNSYYEATPQEEKDKNPIFKERITPLYEKLKVSKNQDEQMELRHQIHAALEQVSVIKYPWHRVKTVTTVGFAYPTPASDGKYVYFVNTLGVAAAYDLDGKRKWIKLITEYGEHGKLRDTYNIQFWNIASPLVVGDTLYINRYGLAALDKETGKEKWYVANLYPPVSDPSENRGNPANIKQYQCTSPIYGKIGDVGVIVAGLSSVVRASDGKLLWYAPNGNCNMPTPVFNEGIIYGSSITVLEPDPSTMGSDTPAFKAKSGGPWSFTSPLFYKDLLYVCSTTGLLSVFDPKEMKGVYTQQLDLNALQLYHTIGGGFLSADGKGRIFAMDNQGNTVVLESGRVFKQLAKNKIEHFVHRIYCVPQQESGQSNMFIDGNNIFIRSEENLYCIGEKN